MGLFRHKTTVADGRIFSSATAVQGKPGAISFLVGLRVAWCVRALATVLVLCLVPLVGAQEHGHVGENGMSMVLFDGPADGRALVGAYTHFGFALIDKDGNPVVHQNAEFNVLQNGKVLFSTTDTHEYDGLFSLDLRFTRPGPYQVVAHSGEMTLGTFEGEVVALADPVEASISFEAVAAGPASNAHDITIAINDAGGALIPHSDAIVEFRDARDGALYSRSHLHIHDGPITFRQGFGAATEYVALVIGYIAFANADDPNVPAVVAEFPVPVGPLSVPAAPSPELAPPAALEQVGAKASEGGLTLHAMYDPQNQVGVGQAARLAAVITDADHSPLAHVDFAFTLNGPRGLVFSSESLHEYDGMFEYLFYPEAPGSYDGVLTAIDDVELTVPFHLLVVPGAVPVLGGTGPVTLDVKGVDEIVAGVPVNLTFSANGPTGPAKHSEVDVTVFHEGEPPLYQFKLHTHASGLTNAVLLFPHEGDWKIRLDGLPTVPEPSVYLPALVEFNVAPGNPSIQGPAGAEDATPAANMPGAWAAMTAFAIAIAAMVLGTRGARQR